MNVLQEYWGREVDYCVEATHTAPETLTFAAVAPETLTHSGKPRIEIEQNQRHL